MQNDFAITTSPVDYVAPTGFIYSPDEIQTSFLRLDLAVRAFNSALNTFIYFTDLTCLKDLCKYVLNIDPQELISLQGVETSLQDIADVYHVKFDASYISAEKGGLMFAKIHSVFSTWFMLSENAVEFADQGMKDIARNHIDFLNKVHYQLKDMYETLGYVLEYDIKLYPPYVPVPEAQFPVDVEEVVMIPTKRNITRTTNDTPQKFTTTELFDAIESFSESDPDIYGGRVKMLSRMVIDPEAMRMDLDLTDAQKNIFDSARDMVVNEDVVMALLYESEFPPLKVGFAQRKPKRAAMPDSPTAVLQEKKRRAIGLAFSLDMLIDKSLKIAKAIQK